jgi:phosphoglycolate phosphatase
MEEAMEIEKLPQGVIFDWDNTLADGWECITAAMNAARAAFGQGPWSEEEAKRYCTRAARESFPEWFGAEWERAKDIFYGVVRAEHLKKLHPMPGAGDLLDWLKGRGIPLFIVSNKRGDVLRAEVGCLGWVGYFKAVMGALDAEIDKPARDPVDLALAASDLRPENHEIWFIGDKEIDVKCARIARCRPVLLHDRAEAARLGLEESFFSDCKTLLQSLMNCALHNEKATQEIT